MILATGTDGWSAWAEWTNLIVVILLLPFGRWAWKSYRLLLNAARDARQAALLARKQSVAMKQYRRRMAKRMEVLAEQHCTLQDRMNDMEPRVKAIWTGLLSRAEKEVLEHRHGEKNSPLKINAAAKEAVSGELLQDIRYYFDSLPADLDDAELAMKLEQNFGDRIVTEFCNPHGYSEFGCLVLFVAALRGGTADIRHEHCTAKA